MAKPLILILNLSSLLLLLCCSATSTLPVVRRAERKQLMVTEYGEISSVDVSSTANKGPYHVEFITMDPNSLFLPVLLHADMVFYVHSGSGKLSWSGDGEDDDDDDDDGKEVKRVDLKTGDVYRLEPGSVFFLQSDLEDERQKLRIHAIFSTTDEDIWEPWVGAYSSISDLVLGFDAKLLQSAFGVTEGVIEEIASSPKPPGIVHSPASSEQKEKEKDKDKKKKKKSVLYELENRFLKVMAAEEAAGLISLKKSKKSKTFNILENDPDFQNCNGWSLTVDKGNYKTLKGSNMGVFMVNLTKGAMMGPHWNPVATEIAVVLEGKGMVRIVCAANSTTGCKNQRFRVREGDVFVVPRFHPMAQMSFNNGSFVFMGFSTTSKKNHPQFLAGKRSVFQTLDRDILALAFNSSNTTIDQLLLAAQEDAIILECVSCAEEEFRLMVEEIEREREQEEEERKRQEEEERRKREEEERKREEEEERKREEEEAERKRQEEEERKREEEAAERKRREEEEEERKREEEEEERKRREEEERKREEERRESEEAARRRKEEEASREQEEAGKEADERQRKREEAEEEAQRKREEEAKKEEERRQQEEARKEEERQRREEEDRERQRREEEAKEKEEEERERREEEARREQEQARRQQEERQRREEEGEEEHEGGERRRAMREFPWKPWM